MVTTKDVVNLGLGVILLLSLSSGTIGFLVIEPRARTSTSTSTSTSTRTLSGRLSMSYLDQLSRRPPPPPEDNSNSNKQYNAPPPTPAFPSEQYSPSSSSSSPQAYVPPPPGPSNLQVPSKTQQKQQQQQTSPPVVVETEQDVALLDDAVDIFNGQTPIRIQGSSLKTWSFQTPSIQRVLILAKTEGRPLNANIDLWEGPDNTPQKMAVYLEDGNVRTFSCVVETPGSQNAVAIYNTATLEYPLDAVIMAETSSSGGPQAATVDVLANAVVPKIVQGGAVFTKAFAPQVASIQILLRTDGRPLNARVELLQGPNNNKQVVEVYTEDGVLRPFYMIVDAPGSGNVVRIVNTATMEYPLRAIVEPYEVQEIDRDEVLRSGRGLFIVD